MELIGYFGAFLMGVVLGIMGGGGAILTVPILTYLFNIEAVRATGYSLFIVGITSFIGALNPIRSGKVNLKMVALFAVPSMLMVFSVRKFFLPLLPDTLLEIGALHITKNLAVMALFAVVMLFSAIAMIRPRKIEPVSSNQHPFRLIVQGLFVGLIAGSVGAGGGFLIVPALVLLAGLDMKEAVGTSLLIIAIQSLIGFSGELSHDVDWSFLLVFSSIAVAGILVGGKLASRIPNERLKPAFGWFVLTMGIYILAKELITL